MLGSEFKIIDNLSFEIVKRCLKRGGEVLILADSKSGVRRDSKKYLPRFFSLITDLTAKIEILSLVEDFMPRCRHMTHRKVFQRIVERSLLKVIDN